ncbi:MAG: anhydro-N-acetylmuramic acid kinase [Kangiellaceae bacterium]|nr:anhydro-N-acetylmuramic acid kinase [Kangiellaceae bacterium]MCW8999490.1 anhydro-N-acetylmuramic acid kinase [Kangiellaceae bacterium]MCW9016735.1 anhydro-N-acetylmuramic acid kinase [Kangiellaceae bacterium]
MSTSHPSELYIGLMCGTSIDGVDVALVDFSHGRCKLVDYYLHPVGDDVRLPLGQLCDLSEQSDMTMNFHHRIELMGELDVKMGHVFADSVNTFLSDNNIPSSKISAIGSHGQTIRHQPSLSSPFTLQIGDPNIIAYSTGITTVSDFRRMDIAAGGQGAPLAPAFHNAVMRSNEQNRIILNLGGIANITLLAKDLDMPVLGFDTGTANTLMDAHFKKYHPNHADNFDRDGKFAKSGKCNSTLLARLLRNRYFDLAPPKSTGREYFSLNWLQQHLDTLDFPISPEDVQATLMEFSTKTIADAIQKLELADFEVYASGGGMHNQLMLNSLGQKLDKHIYQTNDIGVDGDYLEAMTFAWLARQRVLNLPGNLSSVTGASCEKVLGAIYHP